MNFLHHIPSDLQHIPDMSLPVVPIKHLSSTGLYLLSYDDGVGAVRLQYAAGRSDMPHVICFPGCQSDIITNKSGKIMLDVLNTQHGFPVALVEYAHSLGDKPAATMNSMMDDVAAVSHTVIAANAQRPDAQQDVIIVTDSMSVNPVWHSLERSEHLSGHISDVVSLAPFPDFIEHAQGFLQNPDGRLQTILRDRMLGSDQRRISTDVDELLVRQGYLDVFSPASGKHKRFMKAFIDSALAYDALSDKFSEMVHKPNITAIYNAKDHIVNMGWCLQDQNIVPGWVDHMSDSGFAMNTRVGKGRGHYLSDDEWLQKVFAEEVSALSSRYKGRPSVSAAPGSAEEAKPLLQGVG